MPSAAANPAILIVDDQVADARLIQDTLRDGTDGDSIHLVKDGREAVAFLRREPPFTDAPRPDVIVVGLTPPGAAGREAFDAIRAEAQRPPVIVLGRGAEDPVSRFMHAGASDYLTNGARGPLTRAIDAAITTRLPLRKLSPRQVEVLCLIAQGLATRDIATRLAVSGKTVEAHRAELMRRLEIRTVAGLVRYALRAGLVELGGP